MAEKSFFDVLANYNPLGEITNLAFKKFQVDMEQDKLNMVKDQFNREKAEETRKITAKTKFRDLIQNTLQSGQQVDPRSLIIQGIGLGAVESEKGLEALSKVQSQVNPLFSKVNPKDYTPESVKAFMGSVGEGTPNYDLLKKVESGGGTDFSTFKAGRPRQEGESDADWNKRVSDEWEARQDARAKSKLVVSLEEKEKQRQKVLSSGEADLEKSAGGKDKLDFYYERYVRYGQMPPMGMGMNLRWAFMGGAAQWAKEHGLDARSSQIQSMQTKGSQMAYNNLAKVQSISQVAGETAIKHGNTALEIMDKKDRTGSPVIDRWIRGGMKAIAGDPDVTAFDTNVHMFTRELARYLTSMTAGGVMNQEESNEIQRLVSPNQNPAQFKKNYTTAVRLIREKEKTFNEQLGEIKAAIPGQNDLLDEETVKEKQPKKRQGRTIEGDQGSAEKAPKAQKIGRFNIEVE